MKLNTKKIKELICGPEFLKYNPDFIDCQNCGASLNDWKRERKFKFPSESKINFSNYESEKYVDWYPDLYETVLNIRLNHEADAEYCLIDIKAIHEDLIARVFRYEDTCTIYVLTDKKDEKVIAVIWNID